MTPETEDPPMPFATKLTRRVALAALAVAALAAPAAARTWPSQPVRIIVPFAPGGTTDVLARLVAEELAKSLGKPFVLENRAGASGNIGLAAVVASPADGYTLGIGTISGMAMNRSLYANMTFDSLRDLTPISRVALIPSILVVHPSVPATSVPELVALLKTGATQFSYASPGTGSTGHIGIELFKALAGIKELQHVPYRGTGVAMADLLSGRIQLMLDPAVTSLAMVRNGSLRGLAVASPTRTTFAPEIPAIGEFYPGFDATSWLGIVGPRDLPPAIRDRLSEEVRRALAQPHIVERFKELGAEPAGTTPAEFKRYIEEEAARWAPIIRQSGAKIE